MAFTLMGGTPTKGSTVTSEQEQNIAADAELTTTADAQRDWFPEFGDRDLSLDGPPIGLAGNSASMVVVKEQALIPLPSAAWTGFAGLAAVGVAGCFRNFRRFIFR
jgi:hypothetical protein